MGKPQSLLFILITYLAKAKLIWVHWSIPFLNIDRVRSQSETRTRFAQLIQDSFGNLAVGRIHEAYDKYRIQIVTKHTPLGEHNHIFLRIQGVTASGNVAFNTDKIRQWRNHVFFAIKQLLHTYALVTFFQRGY